MSGLIDSHQHFWSVARGDYGWLTPATGEIYRDFGPDDLAPHLARHGIGKTILVQAAPSVAETLFLLGIAGSAPMVAGVIGWVDFEAADVEDTIADLAANPLLVGLRPMVQDIADDRWLLRPGLRPAFRAMVRHRLVFDALVLPQHLGVLAGVLELHPDLCVVVDHCAKPVIARREMEPWRADMALVAQYPQVSCKLSGLVTEAGADWCVDDLKPFAQHVLAEFGASRVLWGSDWPVVNLAGGYGSWRTATDHLLAGLSGEDRAAILGGNADRIYLNSRGRR